MENKQTAVDYLFSFFMQTNYDSYINYKAYKIAKAMEKEQMIKFAQIVLDKAECSHTGMVYLEANIEDIYNETYKQQDK